MNRRKPASSQGDYEFGDEMVEKFRLAQSNSEFESTIDQMRLPSGGHSIDRKLDSSSVPSSSSRRGSRAIDREKEGLIGVEEIPVRQSQLGVGGPVALDRDVEVKEYRSREVRKEATPKFSNRATDRSGVVVKATPGGGFSSSQGDDEAKSYLGKGFDFCYIDHSDVDNNGKTNSIELGTAEGGSQERETGVEKSDRYRILTVHYDGTGDRNFSVCSTAEVIKRSSTAPVGSKTFRHLNTKSHTYSEDRGQDGIVEEREVGDRDKDKDRQFRSHSEKMSPTAGSIPQLSMNVGGRGIRSAQCR